MKRVFFVVGGVQERMDRCSADFRIHGVSVEGLGVCLSG